MDELAVIWTKTALVQRNSIFNYWNTRNKSKKYSRKLNLAIKERLDILKIQPKIGKETLIENVRTISLRHYSIFYQIDNLSIYIVSFWDNRQDPKRLLATLRKK